MSTVSSYALITAARDEAENLAALAPTVIGQSIQPAAWVIVDDGSSDATPVIARELAGMHPWIVVQHTGRAGHGLRQGRREGRDLLALQQGLQALPCEVDLITKLDADITLPSNYFERLVSAFRSDPDSAWQREHAASWRTDAGCRAI